MIRRPLDDQEQETSIMSECPFRETCARMGGICQCAEEIQRDDEGRRRSETGDDWEGSE